MPPRPPTSVHDHATTYRSNNRPRLRSLRSGNGLTTGRAVQHIRRAARSPAAPRHRSQERQRPYGSPRRSLRHCGEVAIPQQAPPEDPALGRTDRAHPPPATDEVPTVVLSRFRSWLFGFQQAPTKEGRLEKAGPESFPQKLSVLERRLVRYGQFLTTLCATRSQHLAAICRSHTSAETVLVDTLATRRLVSSLHCHSYLVFIVSDIFTDCKSTTKKRSAKIFRENISILRGKTRFSLIFVERQLAPKPAAPRSQHPGRSRAETR